MESVNFEGNKMFGRKEKFIFGTLFSVFIIVFILNIAAKNIEKKKQEEIRRVEIERREELANVNVNGNSEILSKYFPKL